MDATELLAAVEREFATAGADTPPWPDPHEGLDGPCGDEYSRCLDPNKYRIVAARAEAWTRALVAAGLADARHVGDMSGAWATPESDRRPTGGHGTALRPKVEGAIPLLFGLRAVDAPDNNLTIGAGSPAEVIAALPDCGCDACDSGSAYLLTEIDEHVLAVVSGVLVHLRLGATTVIAAENGWSASGAGGRIADRSTIESAVEQVRAGRWTGAALHGRAWW